MNTEVEQMTANEYVQVSYNFTLFWHLIFLPFHVISLSDYAKIRHCSGEVVLQIFV